MKFIISMADIQMTKQKTNDEETCYLVGGDTSHDKVFARVSVTK